MRAKPDLRKPDLRKKSGGIGAAVEEAGCMRVRAQNAGSSRARIQRLILVTDAMIEELELENVRQIRRLSAAWWPRLVLLFSSLPFEVGPLLRRPQTPVEALDLVYEVQERLFALKNGKPNPRPLLATSWRPSRLRLP